MDNNENKDDVEEIKEMIRHLHMDIENVRREQFILEYRMIGITYMLQDMGKGLDISTGIDEKTIDEIVNVPPGVYNEAEICYTPIDIKDKEEWEEHQKSEIDWEKEKEEKFEEL